MDDRWHSFQILPKEHAAGGRVSNAGEDRPPLPRGLCLGEELRSLPGGRRQLAIPCEMTCWRGRVTSGMPFTRGISVERLSVVNVVLLRRSIGKWAFKDIPEMLLDD
jgi:hypothetical protein